MKRILHKVEDRIKGGDSVLEGWRKKEHERKKIRVIKE